MATIFFPPRPVCGGEKKEVSIILRHDHFGKEDTNNITFLNGFGYNIFPPRPVRGGWKKFPLF
ncbi:MAG: hypothetical protein LBR79_03465 [Oscillospiraceae bacterium]|nr:hypothetical protein [Oscillospiraceae bacterium]